MDRLKLRESTLVIFFSDHGHSTEERANFGGGNAGPYRGSKFSVLEGRIRVPCIARLPGSIPAGAIRDQVVVSIDWFPAVAELCGVPLPARRIDGKSLVPVLSSATTPTPHGVYHWQFGEEWAVRQGDWKLVVNANDTEQGKKLQGPDAVFLSDLRRDAAERHNGAGASGDRRTTPSPSRVLGRGCEAAVELAVGRARIFSGGR